MKLVLFDIDGTLIAHVGGIKQVGFPRFIHAIKDVYGMEITPDLSANYNGMLDKSITRALMSRIHISEKEFEEKWPKISHALARYAKLQEKGGVILYQSIADAVILASMLYRRKDVRIGLLTGNVERMAWWKLGHAGILQLFSFGLFGDDVDDRVTLAKTVFEKAEKHFDILFQPCDITVIGDTIYDIRCGKAIGAVTIAVTTGVHTGTKPSSTYREDLADEKPDFLVDSLLDQKIVNYFGLEKPMGKSDTKRKNRLV